MREFKFRAWDKELKFFADQTCYFVGLDGSAWFNNCGDGEDRMIDQSSKLVIEQYTGLKDWNGQDIYEGDILSINEGDSKLTGVVVFTKTFQYKVKEICYADMDYLTLWKGSTVIGNIHDNPELIQST